MPTFTIYTDSLCKFIYNWTLIQTVTLSASDTPTLTLAVGCDVAIALVSHLGISPRMAFQGYVSGRPRANQN